MQRSATFAPADAAPAPLALLAAVAAGVAALRLALLALNGTELFVDEAQYWAWSREPAWGYFSKPPLIAWTIGATTALGGAADPFWVRAASPVLQSLAAVAVGALGAHVLGGRVGLLAGLAWLTMPGVAFGAQLISTDTVMLAPLALAILFWVRAVERPSAATALAAGAFLGVAALGKYAALYAVLCALLWAAAERAGRPRVRDAAIALGAAAAALAPNLIWNFAHSGATLAHTLDNAGVSTGLRPLALLEFLGAQFGVMGPLLFAAWLSAVWRAPRGPLVWFSAPIMALVALQALRAGANANWAAAAFVAATPLAAAELARWGRRALAASFAFGTAASVLLPLAALAPEAIPGPKGRPAFARVLGQSAYAEEVAAVARAEGAGLILADNRALLAALTHGLRDSPVAVAAAPRGGPPRHGWDLAETPPDAQGATLWATLGDPGAPPPGWAAAVALPPPAPRPFMGAREPALHRLER
ncbi:ArnT family glycosyltransferase [Rubrimonas sp.]|uniref:ArnT family glycosyltransferase n=1 Tax=Rubrimonas sp. TaxID=2036015 RepID=UPI002FDCFE6A